MKKLLTVLLTLVMAVSLINLNYSHTKAEGNDSFTVTFDMQGHGTQVEPQTVAAGGTVQEPNDPTAQDYKFGGWYKEAACTNAWYFSTDKVNADTTLYAKWVSDSFTITATEDGTKVKLAVTGTVSSSLQFTDGTNPWADYDYGTEITLGKGKSISFRAKQDGALSSGYANYVKVVVSAGKITASGNIMSLVKSSNYGAATSIPGTYCFGKLFDGCANLISIEGLQLPATTLTEGCYLGMFNGCTGLTSIPKDLLSATTLKDWCYQEMFKNCTSLTSIPSNLLPATTLILGCYFKMFEGCTGLTSIPSGLLPATTIAKSCYSSMFNGCTNLVNIPNLPATGALPDSCYRDMFNGCSSLKLSTDKDANYVVPFSITYSSEGSNSLKDIFAGTTGSFTGKPVSGTTYYVSKDTTVPEVTTTCASGGSVNVNIAKDSGSQIDAILTGYDGTLSTIKLDGSKDLISGSEYTLLEHSSTANVSEKELILSKLLISSLSEGTHTVVLTTDHTPAITYTLNITIQPKPSPSPSDPSKKDESCEKVIGPTWHWNNDKGICEDYGVVGTSTR